MAQVREIANLEWARWAEAGPWPEPKARSGAVKAGLRYERQFGQLLQSLRVPGDTDILAGPWIEFKDSGGRGFAQPDFLLISPRGLYIFECKLTERQRAWTQLFRLYSPLLGALLPGVPQKRVQVCQNLRPGSEGIPVVRRAKQLRDQCIWHWVPSPQFRRNFNSLERRKSAVA